MEGDYQISKTEQKKLPRRSPRDIKPSAALIAAKANMKQRALNSKIVEFVKDDYAVAQMAKTMVRGKTGVIFDDCMTDHYCLWDKNYPECPERYTAVMNRCRELGLIEKCLQLPSRPGTESEILQKHIKDDIEILKNTATEQNVDKLEELSSKYDAVYINNASYKLALLSVGCVVDLVNAVANGSVQNGMAIIRPPGHHAMKGEYCGYCFFNNVALAASQALNAGVKRILIVDWDVHHGQATQQMFYDDPRVLYFSIHRYEHGSFWPNLRESDFNYIGTGEGKGYNFNVPLNATGMTDADYLAIFQQILLPVAYEFEPELVLVSAGYDAAIGCPEGEMNITPACYAHLTSSLMGLAGGKIAVILEGGYCLKSLAEGAALTLRALQGAPTPAIQKLTPPCKTIVGTILDVIYTHKQYWQSLQLQEVLPVTRVDADLHIPWVLYLGDESKPEKYATRDCYPVQSAEFLADVDARLNKLQVTTKLIDGPRVGLLVDLAMLAHENTEEGDHPEKPERIKAIFERHNEFGLMERCVKLKSRPATEEELLLCHTPDHLSEMKKTVQESQTDLNTKAEKFDSVYLNPRSFECALLSAGSVLEVVDRVLGGDITSGVAVVRPPGHHAESDVACGFCLFNNVGVAAKYAVEVHGLKRVVLLDWDVHHGNGSQRMFEEDPRILYISLHRYNRGKFFPASEDADCDKIGLGRGAGFNINIPWNKPGGGMTDGDYIAAFHSIILPVLYQFEPQIILVSAGFDACINDPLGHCKVTPEAYAHMTHWLLPLAQGRLVLALEGGYNVTSISYAMTLCTKALLGDPIPPLTSTTTPSPSALESIRNVITHLEPYWSCLAFLKALPNVDVLQISKLTKSEKEALNSRLSEITELTKGIKTLAAGDEPGPSKSDTSKGSSSSQGQSAERSGAVTSTLADYLRENEELLTNEEMFAVVPVNWCPHLEQVSPVPQVGIDVATSCASCSTPQENWACLSCYTVQCGRHVNGHMMEHAEMAAHPLCVSFADLSVWCYGCESYVDNQVLYNARNAVHLSKFGSELPWTYGQTSEILLS